MPKRLMSSADSDLWEAIINGDNRAWAELVRRYQALVYAVCTRSGLSLADAADCFQQTWVTLYKKRKSIHDPSRLSAWLVTTAKREVWRVKRRLAKMEPIDIMEKQIAAESRPDEDLEQLESQAHLEIAMQQLGLRCREIIEIFFFAPVEQTYDQIARTLNISPNSLGPIRRRCLERLKSILLKNGFPGVRNDDSETL